MEPINQEDLLKLNSFYHSDSASISFMFAPTKSGKTTFLRNFIVKKNYIYIGINHMLRELLFPFIAQNICKKLNIKIPTSFFTSFDKILKLIDEHTTTQRLTVIIDDFHTLLKIDKDACDTLLNFFNKKDFNPNLQFIITSSSYFENKTHKKILKYSSHTFELETFKFNFILNQPGLKTLDKMYIYSCFGASSYLLSHYNKKVDFIKNLYHITLNPTSPYFNYGDEYLNENLSEISTYTSILYAIALGNNKIGEIADKLNVQSTYLSRYIQKLQDLMIIKKELPLDDKLKHSKLGRYFFKDNFLKFWFCYIFPNRAYLEMKKQTMIIKEIDKTIVDMIIIPSYKNILQEFLKENANKYLGYTPTKIGPWWDNHGNNIDIITCNEEQITFIKVLWESSDANDENYAKLKEVSTLFKTTLNPNYIIITKNTFINNFQNI